jgi:hypothetical protein
MNDTQSKLTIDVRPVEEVQAPDFWDWIEAGVAVAKAIYNTVS